MSQPTELVRRHVNDAMNGRDLRALDPPCTPALAPKLRTALEQFLVAFPEWRRKLVELVAEDDTVVARFRFTGTHHGERQRPRTDRPHAHRRGVFLPRRRRTLHPVLGREDTWTRMRQHAGDDITLRGLGSLSGTKRTRPWSSSRSMTPPHHLPAPSARGGRAPRAHRKTPHQPHRPAAHRARPGADVPEPARRRCRRATLRVGCALAVLRPADAGE